MGNFKTYKTMANMPTSVGVPQMVVLTTEQLKAMIDAAAENAVEKYCEEQTKQKNKQVEMKAFDEDRFLTPKEAAKMFHVDKSTLHRWRAVGLPYLKVGPRRTLYKLSDILGMTELKGKHNKKTLQQKAENVEPEKREDIV